MNFEQLESGRAGASFDILKKIGETIGRAEKSAAQKIQDPTLRKLTAARVSLEYAVIETARERSVPTNTVADALAGATVVQQTMLIKEGRAALARAFNVEPEVLVSAFTGKLVGMEMPRGMGSTPELDKMIDSARNLVTSIVGDEYANRGRYFLGGSDRDGFVSLKTGEGADQSKVSLATRLAFIESSIDAGTAKGDITATNAAMLKDRIESQIFQPRPPQSIQFSDEFRKYFQSRGLTMRTEVMQDVRGITQSRTVKEITEKLSVNLQQTRRDTAKTEPLRATKELER